MSIRRDDSPPDRARGDQAWIRIVVDYKEGRLSLEEAASQLRDALREVPGGINVGMSPSIRRLFAEVARLEGRSFSLPPPDPDRHAGGAKWSARHLAGQVWRAVTNHPRAGQPLSIGCHFAAATEDTARAIAQWLERHGQEHVHLKSPSEADTYDWIITATTRPAEWSRAAIDQWAEMVHAAPLAGEASFTGWGV